MKYRIMVVEDSFGVAEATKAILSMSGYDVDNVTNGKEALKLLEKRVPHLILSDIMMPIMDGLTFYEEFRKNPAWNQIPFIFLTARSQREDVRKAKKMGADDYIIKPFSAEDLLAVVEGKLHRMASLVTASRQQVQDFRHEVINTLSHEMRTPLTKIQGYVELVMRKLYDNEGQLDTFMEQIRDGGDRLNQIVEDFLKIMRLEISTKDNTYEQNMTFCDARNFIISLKDYVIQEAMHEGITVHFSLDEDETAMIFASEQDITEALYQLINNAVKFSQKGGKVDVRLIKSPEEVIFEVQDYGIGINPENIPFIFEKFYQSDRSEQEQKGIGLGLAIVDLVVRKNKGQIRVDSKLHQGSMFSMSFPLVNSIDMG